METLGWELTVCNSLEPENSPCRKIIKNSSTFGSMLTRLLEKKIDFSQVKNILEIGGGYGFLMRDLLKKHPGIDTTMLDISPFLIEKQRDTLKEHNVKFFNMDFFAVGNDMFGDIDLAILNENVGDFETICDIDQKIVRSNYQNLDEIEKKIYDYFDKFKFNRNLQNKINLNSGAIDAVEKLCSAGIKYIYISEHSCEALAPARISEQLQIAAKENPEKISLKGHDEYTIKFSDLEKVAEYYDYQVIRGQYKDFIEVDYDERINFILSSNTENDEHEIVRHFIYDTYKYEYLILIKNYSAVL
jgi:phospholipid N-methyltransferase